ncbi:CRISPR-associated endonuclease Cas1 [Desulfurella sp.]|uniref:CRISPR-associated endonuclease Cas1 n=1 Tax=Desulfurella sp. TaxID=1962857 RepID=UPI0025C73E7D|nr:CRISPR-associated endonuclease Cas1 [Desulfurella sp.]
MKGLLFVATPKSIVSRKNNNICVYNENGQFEFPIGSIEHVFLLGGINITTPTIKFLNTFGKCVFLLNQFGKLITAIIPEHIGSDYSLRLAQYKIMLSQQSKIHLVNFLLKEKAKSVGYILGLNESAYNRSIYIKSLISNASTRNLQEALGIDGSLNSKLFQFMRENLLPENFEFNERDYKPPKDPVNAVLSLTYTMYYSLLVPISMSYGFDPYLSFFHTKRGKHASLCSDLIEISRPWLTLFVFENFKNAFFDPSDFVLSENGCFLKEKALKSYVKLFSEKVIHGEYIDQTVKFILNLKEKIYEISNNL